MIRWDNSGKGEPLLRASAAADAMGSDLRAVVLVEGVSDQAALEALADRCGRDLVADGVSVVPMGGAKSIRRFLELFGPSGLDVQLAGLYDVAEEPDFRRGLERVGLGTDLDRDAMEDLGFFVCTDDLEDELIRSLGVAAVERVIEIAGELASLRSLQQMPAQRDRPPAQVLRRFMGARSGRKTLYGRLLVEALDLDEVPRPLHRALAAVAR